MVLHSLESERNRRVACEIWDFVIKPAGHLRKHVIPERHDCSYAKTKSYLHGILQLLLYLRQLRLDDFGSAYSSLLFDSPGW